MTALKFLHLAIYFFIVCMLIFMTWIVSGLDILFLIGLVLSIFSIPTLFIAVVIPQILIGLRINSLGKLLFIKEDDVYDLEEPTLIKMGTLEFTIRKEGKRKSYIATYKPLTTRLKSIVEKVEVSIDKEALKIEREKREEKRQKLIANYIQ